MRVIYILWLRQLKRFFRKKSRIAGSIGQPVLFLVALSFGLGPVFREAGRGDYLQFLTPGVIAMSIIFSALFSGVEIIWDKQFGFLKETLVAPISRWQIMIGRTLGGATISLLQGLIILIISSLFGFSFGVSLLPLALVFMILIALLFTAIGTCIASTMNDMQGFQLIMNFLVMPLFFLSGALFPLKNLPTFLTVVVNINPLSYGVDGLRYALIHSSHFSPWLDFSVLSLVSLGFLLLGTYLFYKLEID